MKVLLVYPYFLDNRINEEDVSAIPMGLYYVGAMLQANGHNVAILNAYDLKQSPHRIRELINQNKPDVVGFSILHANRWGGIDIARMVKESNPTATFVFGGVGAQDFRASGGPGVRPVRPDQRTFGRQRQRSRGEWECRGRLPT